jgi:hypothetical protein
MYRYLNLPPPESQEIRGLFRPRDRIATWKGGIVSPIKGTRVSVQLRTATAITSSGVVFG